MTTRQPRASTAPHWIEGLVAGLGLLLMTTMFAAIAYDIARYEAEPPAFEIVVTEIAPEAGQHRVTFHLHNTSLATAAEVHVIGTITEGGAEVEEADVTFDYVASESRDEGALFFRHDPTGALHLRVAGYTDP